MAVKETNTVGAYQQASMTRADKARPDNRPAPPEKNQAPPPGPDKVTLSKEAQKMAETKQASAPPKA